MQPGTLYQCKPEEEKCDTQGHMLSTSVKCNKSHGQFSIRVLCRLMTWEDRPIHHPNRKGIAIDVLAVYDLISGEESLTPILEDI